jgi:hypothetical protein
MEDNNYHRWLAFNESLAQRLYAESLYQVVFDGAQQNTLSCKKIDEGGVSKYIVQDSNIKDTLILSEKEKENMLNYLKAHYLPAGNQTNQVESTHYKSTDLETIAQLHAKSSNPRSKFFFNKKIRKHVVGYALIGFFIFQFFVIPTNVFSIKYPEYSKALWAIFFASLTYVAVINYKREFLVGGIRYGTVSSITFWLYTIIFLIGGIEIALIDFIKDRNIFGAIVIIPIILIASYLSGWILSFPIYFLSGGKIVTDPNEIRLRD